MGRGVLGLLPPVCLLQSQAAEATREDRGEVVMGEVVTICVECKWCREYGGVLPDHMCVHPDFRRRPLIDPVTGEPCITKHYERYPDCCLTNYGLCRRYEASETKAP